MIPHEYTKFEEWQAACDADPRLIGPKTEDFFAFYYYRIDGSIGAIWHEARGKRGEQPGAGHICAAAPA